MKTRNSTLRAAIAGMAIALLSVTAHAQSTPVAGQVQKVDESAGKVTIKHNEIPNLQMDAMTMVFKAAEGVSLTGLKAGDKITFEADKVNGQLTVTKVEKSK